MLKGSDAEARWLAENSRWAIENDMRSLQQKAEFDSARKISRRPAKDFPMFLGKIEPSKMNVGDVGRFLDQSYVIHDIIDDQNMLIRAFGNGIETTVFLVDAPNQ